MKNEVYFAAQLNSESSKVTQELVDAWKTRQGFDLSRLDKVVIGETRNLFYMTIRDAAPSDPVPQTLGDSYKQDTTMRHRVMSVVSAFDFEIEDELANYVFERYSSSQTPIPIFKEKQ